MPTNDSRDLELLLRSHIPLLVIETHEEPRVLAMFQRLITALRRPLYHWSITEGLRRADIAVPASGDASDPGELLRRIKAAPQGGIYLLADFHPYLNDPTHIRLIKEIALAHEQTPHTLVFISHALDMPADLRRYTARFEPSLPTAAELERIVHEEAERWARQQGSGRVRTDRRTLDTLIRNLGGLTATDARRLIRGAIQDDGAITESDLPQVMAAKYRLLEGTGGLSFEYDTARFSDIGGLPNLKRWLQRRRDAFVAGGIDAPKGILLVGVQGSGKSLAAKAVAGLWQLPLLRLDVGALYDKYIGQSERNLRDALKTAEVMAPCVLWLDEVEKALALGNGDDGVSRRMLGTLLTWMAEKKAPVFIVATSNAIDRLPPELIRKGRLDEIFFVDLPDAQTRREIFAIHLRKRDQDPTRFDLDALAAASASFSGAEIEQAVVAGLYLARERQQPLATSHLLAELRQTRPLAVVMRESVEALRQWAAERTIPA